MKTTATALSSSVRSIGLLALSAGIAATLSAQTTRPAVTHHAATHSASAVGGCIKLPEIASTVPALPAGTPCAKALYTLTRTPDIKLDYVSPLVSPEVRDTISSATQTFSLGYVDTIVGKGELVRPNTFLSVKYSGYLTDGKKFDSSYDHPNAEPLNFQHGTHRVIEGWDTGFEGMHIGGKRRLYIPYQLAYGDAGRPPVIPAKSMLVFDVEVVSQSDKAPEPKAPPARPMPPTPHMVPPAGATTPAPSAAKPAAPATTAPKQ